MANILSFMYFWYGLGVWCFGLGGLSVYLIGRNKKNCLANYLKIKIILISSSNVKKSQILDKKALKKKH